MKLLLALGLSCFLIGCSTTSGLKPITSTSSFDGVKSVGIKPHGAMCKGVVCPSLGATWLDNQQDNVGFSVELFNTIENIYSLSFNIDGEIITIKALQPTIFSQSVGTNTSITSIVTEYKLLTKILQSQRTWMKVSTSKGAYEAAIIDGLTDSKAFHALKRFDTQVNEAKTNRFK